MEEEKTNQQKQTLKKKSTKIWPGSTCVTKKPTMLFLMENSAELVGKKESATLPVKGKFPFKWQTPLWGGSHSPPAIRGLEWPWEPYTGGGGDLK